MGRFFWSFHRVADGVISMLPVARLEAWLRGEVPLGAIDGYVYTALVAGPCIDRRPVEIDFVELSRHPVTANGKRSERHRRHEMREVFAEMDPPPLPLDANLLDARQKFLGARNRARWSWTPTKADSEALRAAINKKARCPLI